VEIVWNITAWFIVAQVLMLVAYAAQNSAYMVKQRVWILVANMIAIGFQMGAFAALGAWTGFWMLGISISRSAAFLANELVTKGKPKNRIFDTIVLGGVVIGAVLVTVFTYESWHDLLSVVAVLVASIGLWQRNVKIFRILAIPMTMMWLVYMIVVGALVGIVFESISLGVVICSVILYKKSVDKVTTDVA